MHEPGQTDALGADESAVAAYETNGDIWWSADPTRLPVVLVFEVDHAFCEPVGG